MIAVIQVDAIIFHRFQIPSYCWHVLFPDAYIFVHVYVSSRVTFKVTSCYPELKLIVLTWDRLQ